MPFDNTSMPPMDASFHPVKLGECKIGLQSLPSDVKAGDSVTLKVSRIDKANGSAYLTPEGDEESAEPETIDQNGQSEEEAEPEQAPGTINSDLLLGPMSKLKGYLAQKSANSSKRTNAV